MTQGLAFRRKLMCCAEVLASLVAVLCLAPGSARAQGAQPAAKPAGQASQGASNTADLDRAYTLLQAVRPVRPMLGQLLLECGVISADQLRSALDEQKRDGRRLGEILVAMGAISPGTIESKLRELQ